MTSDVTFDDLAEAAGFTRADDDGGDGGDDGGGGFDLVRLADSLHEKGLLEPFLFGPEHARGVDDRRPEKRDLPPAPMPMDDDAEQVEDAEATAGATAGASTEIAESLSARAVRAKLLQLYDSTHMIPGLSEDPTLSELIRWMDENEAVVDRFIKEAL